MKEENILILKIDEFIRKYYKNLLVRGAIYALAIVTITILSILLLQYFGQFDTTVRMVLFFVFLLSILSTISYYILLPLLKIYKIGKVISYEEASVIIGNHFSEISDKLLNTLQLMKSGSITGTSQDLLQHAIQQKISTLKPLPFNTAIDISKNRKYLKYALIPLFVFIALAIYKPIIFSDSAMKIVAYNTHFEKPMPFLFHLQNEKLEVIQGNDLTISLKVNGQAIPEEVFVKDASNNFKMEKLSKTEFEYTFRNLQNEKSFRLLAGGFESNEYLIKVLPNPSILNFEVTLDYPAYTHKNDEKLINIGDINAPVGTKIIYNANTKDADEVLFSSNGSSINFIQQKPNEFSYSLVLKQNSDYALKTKNKVVSSKDSLPYSLQAIPDLYPAIEAEERRDSVNLNFIYFRGYIKDDYGFSKLVFHIGKTNQANVNQKLNVNIAFGISGQEFFYAYDLSQLNVTAGDELEYYFEVWDNDGYNGPKAAQTQKFSLKLLSSEQLAAKSEKANSEIKKSMNANLKSLKDIQKEIAELNKKMLEKKALSYDEIKRMNELLKKQKELEKNIADIQKKNDELIAEKNQFEKPNDELLEKQKQLQDLMSQLLPEDLKEKMKELEKLLQENANKEKVQEALEKLKDDNKNLEKELDRTLEVFKKMEAEQKLQNSLEKLDKLADKQEKLAQKTEDAKSNSEELKKEQDELNKEFQEFKKEMDEIEKMAKELEMETEEMFGEQMDKKQDDISNDMEQSEQQLAQKQKKQAKENQKKAAQKMQQMSQQLKSMAQQAEDEQQEEDMQALRQILDNLVKLSFDQEDLMGKFKTISTTDPKYVKLNQQQKKLKDDAKMIEDSLFALSKRQPMIQPIVNKEIGDINNNINKSIQLIADRRTPEAAGRQQYVMTALNNLALLLNESLEQMQQSMSQNSKSGSGSCSKPGGSGSKGGKPKQQSAAQMKKMQEKINKEIEKLKKQLELEKAAAKDGKKPGEKPGEKPGSKPGEKPGSKPGEKPGESGETGPDGKPTNSSAEQLAKIAAQQEALRRELQKAMNSLKKDGKEGSGELQKIADQMEKTESDLVNKRITQETLRRQEEILTRLLEAENAEREREFDEKRQSNEAKNQNLSNPKQFFEYKGEKKKETEMLRMVPPSLNSFYKNKVNDYFNSLNK